MLQYRLLLAAPQNNVASGKVLRSWAVWLKSKGYAEFDEAFAIALTNGITRLPDGSIHTRSTSTSGAFRLRLLEEREIGRIVSTLTYVPLAGPAQVGLKMSAWMELTVDVDQSALTGPQPFQFKSPRIAAYLLNDAAWIDFGASVVSPAEVSRNQVAELVAFIKNTQRKLPAIVCSPPHLASHEVWRESLLELQEQTRGIATIWILDHEAVAKFNDRIGEGLQVYGGAVRTYLPDLEGSLEGVRDARTVHKPLRWDFLRDKPDRAARVVTFTCREVLLDAQPWTPAPKSLNTISVTVDEIPSIALRTETPSAGPDERLVAAESQVTALLEETRLLREAQNTATVQAEAALQLAEVYDAERQNSRREARLLDDENAALLREIEDMQLQLQNLKLALVAAQTPDAEAVSSPLADPASEWPEPASFAELLELLELTEEVKFTGDQSAVDRLEEQQNRRTVLGKTWATVLSMAAYARASQNGRFSGTFYSWCASDDPSVTRRVSPKSVAPTESDSVQNSPDFMRARTFPVPTSVAPEGQSVMLAHVKLGVGGLFPRLYYLEHEGVVYIGYIGPHLPNTKT